MGKKDRDFYINLVSAEMRAKMGVPQWEEIREILLNYDESSAPQAKSAREDRTNFLNAQIELFHLLAGKITKEDMSEARDLFTPGHLRPTDYKGIAAEQAKALSPTK